MLPKSNWIREKKKKKYIQIEYIIRLVIIIEPTSLSLGALVWFIEILFGI